MSLQRNIASAFAAACLVLSSANAREKKVKRSDLPPAVERTVAAQSAGATIVRFSQEKEHGQTFYEAEMMVNGHTKDVLIDSAGTLVEVEEEVALDHLPAEVQAGLTAKTGGRKVLKVESIKKRDKLVAYEAHVDRGAKRSEVQVGPDGKALNHEE